VESQDRDNVVTALQDSARRLAERPSIRDLEDTLGRIVHAAVETVPGVDAGGVSMTENGQVESRVPTIENISKLDQLQSELHEGPCITAVDDPPPTGVVVADDLAGPEDRERWPNFAPQAVETGYRAILSTQLSTTGARRAALNLYAERPGSFDADARMTAGLFATQASLLLYGADSTAEITRALANRDVIGQAKGILMERFGLSDQAAFEMLVTSSQKTNLKLVDVARWLTTERAARSAGSSEV
jgi:hypothetical protein